MIYKILEANPVLSTHKFFVDEIVDLQELPVEPASTALVAATGDTYICNNAGEGVMFIDNPIGNDSESLSEQQELVEFGIMQTDINGNYVSEPIVPILINNEPYTGTFKIQLLEDAVLLIGTTYKGDIITFDGSDTTADESVIRYSDSKNSFITEFNNEIPSSPYEYAIASSKFTVLAAGQCSILNLVVKLADGATMPETPRWRIKIESANGFTPDLNSSIAVPIGATISVDSADNPLPYYQIDNGDPIEIPYIMDIGCKFTMPEGEVTLSVYPYEYVG